MFIYVHLIKNIHCSHFQLGNDLCIFCGCSATFFFINNKKIRKQINKSGEVGVSLKLVLEVL